MKKLLFLFISLFLFSCEEEPPEAIETYSGDGEAFIETCSFSLNVPDEGVTVPPSSGFTVT